MPHAPRLLHLLDYVPTGFRTLDATLLAHAGRLAADGWAVRFGFAGPPPPGYADALARAGAGWTTADFPFTWRAAGRLARREPRPDVLQASFLSPFSGPLLGLKLRRFARRLVVLDHASGTVPARRGVRRLLTRARGTAVGRVVDAVAPVSEANARRAVERVGLPAAKVRVIPNGVPVGRFPAPVRPVRPGLRVAFAGQLTPAKGPLVLLQAIARAAVPEVELDVAGAGPQEAELKAFASEHRLAVRFHGHTNDVPGLFAAADVVAVPSVWAEAFGLVAAEGMAAGAAVLVSDAGALPEVVGPAGVVAAAGDADAWSAALRSLAADPGRRAELGRLARQRAVERYSLEANADRHAELCRDVLRGAP